MKIYLQFILAAVLLLSVQNNSNAQQRSSNDKPKKQVLLIGTFHFDNPGADLVKIKTFDITTPAAQKDLNIISNQIKRFAPDKFFVEWDFTDEKALDTLYNFYQHGTYYDYIKQKYSKRQFNFYSKSETFQLAFRAAKNAGLKKVNSIDHTLSLPFDSVMNTLKSAGQTDILEEIESTSAAMAAKTNAKMQQLGLRELILDMNTAASRKENAGFYIKTINKAGKTDNFIGADAVAAWYKRNLYMYSLVQKQLQSTDQRIVILLGAGHIAMIKKFIEDEGEFEVVELKDLK